MIRQFLLVKQYVPIWTVLHKEIKEKNTDLATLTLTNNGVDLKIKF